MLFIILVLVFTAAFLMLRWLLIDRHEKAITDLDDGAQVWAAPFREPRRGIAEKLDTLGIAMSTTTFLVLMVVCGVLVFALALLVRVPPGFAFVIAAGGALLPRVWLDWSIERRARQLAGELPSAVEDIAGALRVRQAVRPALEEVMHSLRSVDPDSLLAAEFERVLGEAELHGGSVQVALESLQERTANDDLARLSGTLIAFDRAGPDMLDMLADKAAGMRDQLELKARIRSKISEQRQVQRLAPVMMVLTYFFLHADPMVRRFQSTMGGQLLIALVAGAMGLGHIVIRTLIQDAQP